MNPEILLVDDEVDNVDALERLFRKDYKVFKATSGAQGLDILKDNPNLSLIISDQRMPEMTGVEMLKKSIKTHPEAIRILLTGYTDIESVVGAINSGQVYRYITKPWDPVDLKNTVDKSIEKYNLRRELVVKNRELENAYSELKVLDEAKNNFMILINHELKTPLTVISSYLELLNESQLDDEQKLFVGKLLQSKDRLQKLVNDALTLVTAETGLLKVSKKKVSAEKIVRALAGRYDELAEKRKLQLIFNCDAVDVKADFEHIVDVLDRLLENAVKFADKNSDVRVHAAKEDDQVIFTISNKGKSLDQKTIDKILKPFALDENIMNHTQGLGLGLSLCQAILKCHDSQLDLTSQKGVISASFSLS